MLVGQHQSYQQVSLSTLDDNLNDSYSIFALTKTKAKFNWTETNTDQITYQEPDNDPRKNGRKQNTVWTVHLDRNFRVHKYLSGLTGGRIDKTREIRETKGAARGVSPFNKPELNMANERPQFRYASLVIRGPGRIPLHRELL